MLTLSEVKEVLAKLSKFGTNQEQQWGSLKDILSDLQADPSQTLGVVNFSSRFLDGGYWLDQIIYRLTALEQSLIVAENEHNKAQNAAQKGASESTSK